MAVELRPSYAAGWCEVGNARHSLKDYAGAEKAYRKGLEANPKDSVLWANLAGSLWRQERMQEAQACVQEARRLGLKEHWSFNKIGVVQ